MKQQRRSQGTYAYTQTGIYTISLKVDGDNHGDSGELAANRDIVVLTPTEVMLPGTVTLCPRSGAFPGDRLSTGQATFGFVVEVHEHHE